LKELKYPVIEEPEAPEGKKIIMTKDSTGQQVEEKVLTESQKLMYTERLKKFVNQEEQMKSTLASIYTVVIRQCSKLMTAKLDGWKEFEEVGNKSDPVRLLKQIQVFSRQHSTEKQNMMQKI